MKDPRLPVPRNMARLRVLSCTLFLLLSGGSECGTVTVTTKSGAVRGGSQEFSGLHRNGSCHSFQGIPYAQPPVGDLKWLPPRPLLSPWAGTLDGSVSPPMCVQGFPDPETTHDSLNLSQPLMFGYEDCLILNVYTRDPTPPQLLPGK